MRMLLGAILILAASGCDDDDWEEDPWDGIWITYPKENVETDKETSWVSGRVSSADVSVRWTCGAQSGGAAVTTSREGGGWPFYGWFVYTHSWSFQVDLSLGDNVIAVTGQASDGRRSTVSVVVRRFEPALSAKTPSSSAPSSMGIPGPVVAIDTPNSLGVFATGLSEIRIGGSASNAISVDWSNPAAGASGAAAGLSPWTAKVPLVPGMNAVSVRALNAYGHENTALIDIVFTDPASVDVLGFGSNSAGQLGNGTTQFAPTPTPTPALISKVSALAAGTSHALALMMDGTVWVWGRQSLGEQDSMPRPMAGLSDVRTVDAGSAHSVVLTHGGVPWVWGYQHSPTPEPIPGLSGVMAIAAGGYHSVALLSDGTVRTVEGATITQPALTDVIAISAGIYHSVALRRDGTLWIWGAATLTPPMVSLTPTPIPLSDVAFLGRGGCSAVLHDGGVWTWAVANGNVTHPSPVVIPAPIAAVDFMTHGVALALDGSVWTWGDDSEGQLGDGVASSTYALTPRAVPGISGATAITRGLAFTLVRRTP